MRTELHDFAMSCQCGEVALQTEGKPIMNVVCYCSSCQEAGRALERSPEAPQVLNRDGGTAFVVVRKDRVRCVKGQGLLQEHRLKPESPTRRMVASCCNSAMFLDFSKGHWLSLFGHRLPGGPPAPEMRVMTAHRRADEELPRDVPNYSKFSGRFMWKMLGAWVAMGFRVPKDISGVKSA